MKLSELAETYDVIAKAKSDPQRVRIMADLMRGSDTRSLAAIAHFTAGEIVDPALSNTLGIGPGTILDAMARLAGKERSAIDDEVRESGDISALAARYAGGGDDTLTVANLWRRINRVVERDEPREKLIAHIFSHTTPNGARYFTRMLLNQMRIGVGFGTLTRSIARAFNADANQLQRLYALSNSIGLVATQAKKGNLARTGLTLFRPYQFMNAQKIDDPAEIFAKLAGKQILFEVKYDGARLQIHIGEGDPVPIKLYSRRLNDVTDSLPDVVAALRKGWKGGSAIIEGEAVPFDATLTQKQPFQAVLTRLGRKYDIDVAAREMPFILYLFDILYDAGRDMMDVPQSERRGRLSKLVRISKRLGLTEARISDRREEEREFFARAIGEGQEGLVAKDPDAIYLPGKRTEYWMKIKPAFETLDVVVVGGIWGSGRRRGMLSSLVVAVRDGEEFRTVGKVGTGFSEESLRRLTATLEPLIVTARGRDVAIEPSIVIEVDFQGIQKTNAYTSGYALRIPRFKRERIDKSIREADTVERLVRLYGSYH
ncbi:MAG: putative ligase [Chlorobi bacterium]|nr:putative ligase [Chlorobiota bacterium]